MTLIDKLSALTGPDRARQVADSMTQAQQLALVRGYSCGLQKEMVKLGLWKREFPNNSTYYLNTELGNSVRDVLKSRGIT